ncbi:MAG TPA: hypothetical protein VFQ78_12595, partial [Candidatus Udaeobacter sp.]|nr:hypothetical protein [Candidatus Udaeobacter sp.]
HSTTYTLAIKETFVTKNVIRDSKNGVFAIIGGVLTKAGIWTRSGRASKRRFCTDEQPVIRTASKPSVCSWTPLYRWRFTASVAS